MSPPRAGTRCASAISFRGQVYLETDVGPFTRSIQELSPEGQFPACQDAWSCRHGGEGNFATDVWLLDGADPATAVVGLREGTHRYVVYVRRGADPADARGLGAHG